MNRRHNNSLQKLFDVQCDIGKLKRVDFKGIEWTRRFVTFHTSLTGIFEHFGEVDAGIKDKIKRNGRKTERILREAQVLFGKFNDVISAGFNMKTGFDLCFEHGDKHGNRIVQILR